MVIQQTSQAIVEKLLLSHSQSVGKPGLSFDLKSYIIFFLPPLMFLDLSVTAICSDIMRTLQNNFALKWIFMIFLLQQARRLPSNTQRPSQQTRPITENFWLKSHPNDSLELKLTLTNSLKL